MFLSAFVNRVIRFIMSYLSFQYRTLDVSLQITSITRFCYKNSFSCQFWILSLSSHTVLLCVLTPISSPLSHWLYCHFWTSVLLSSTSLYQQCALVSLNPSSLNSCVLYSVPARRQTPGMLTEHAPHTLFLCLLYFWGMCMCVRVPALASVRERDTPCMIGVANVISRHL